MNDLFEQVAEPQAKSTPRILKDSNYFDCCPSCGELKQIKAKLCRKCRYPRPPERPEIVIIDGSQCRYLPLTKEFYAIVDLCLYAHLNQWRWSVSYSKRAKRFYVSRGERGTKIYLHHAVLGVSNGLIDHANHNTLDCRTSNLRPCNKTQNGANMEVEPERGTSRFKGVHWDKKQGKWRATIVVSYKQHFLGYFSDEHAAALAYNEAALKHFGEFAYLNHIES